MTWTIPFTSPVAFHIGPLPVFWYGLTYVLSFILISFFGTRDLEQRPRQGLTPLLWEGFILWAMLGVVLGGRLGYMFFYTDGSWLDHPLELFKTWQGGMSFHGGLLGMILATLIYCKKHNIQLHELCDLLARWIPLGIMIVRMGNFMNGELWGRPTDSPWGMIFTLSGTDDLRHPSPLYEALGEGLFLFLLMSYAAKKHLKPFAMTSLFLIGYACARMVLEFFREPDAHIGFIAFGWLSMGQLLCLPMMLAGLGLWLRHRR